MALSEGSYIAPEIAATDTRVKSLILLSGNTWSWLEEEVMWLPADQQQARRDFLENVVVPNPVFDKYYGDFWSYAYFDSYNTDMTYRTLEASQLPVLALNGVNDDVLWIQGAVDNMHKLINVEHKRNIEFHMIPSATHYLRCDPDDTTCDQAAMSAIVKGYLDSFVDRTL
jgi:pimeloyl-ACP methyl ester carboxylesterase